MLYVLAALVASAHAAQRLSIVRTDGGGIELVHDYVQDAVVSGEVEDRNAVSGYYQLHSVASDDDRYRDDERAYYLGYAEGYLLAPQIQDHMQNVADDMFSELYDGKWPDKFREYAAASRARIVHEYNTHGLEPFWAATYLMGDRYISGMHAGYMRYGIDHPSAKLLDISEDDLYMLSSIGDWEIGLELLLYGDNETVLASYERRRAEGRFSHCSGCVRIANDLNEIFTGHTTWTSWGFGFLRVAKLITFNFNSLNTTFQRISFSSYPGFVSSVDDFYIIQAENRVTASPIKFSVLETSYNIMNTTAAVDALSAVKDTSILTWVRTMVANLIAPSAAAWPEVFVNSISYTYNDNWLIADYALLDEINAACSSRSERDSYIRLHRPTLLVSLEVVPGYYKVLDATDKLIKDGLFISINVPTDPSVRRKGYFTDADPFEGDPRQVIFMREGVSVGSCKSMLDLMRYNNYKNDAESKKDPANSIASRYDLRNPDECGKHPMPFGAVDAKVVANYNFDDMSFWAVFGPTVGTYGDLPKFSFSDWPDLPHRGVGQPTLPTTTSPSLIAHVFQGDDGQQSPIVTAIIILIFLGVIAAVFGIAIKVTIRARRLRQIGSAHFRAVAGKEEHNQIDLDALEQSAAKVSSGSDSSESLIK